MSRIMWYDHSIGLIEFLNQLILLYIYKGLYLQ
jgi:hypothetical protein